MNSREERSIIFGLRFVIVPFIAVSIRGVAVVVICVRLLIVFDEGRILGGVDIARASDSITS